MTSVYELDFHLTLIANCFHYMNTRGNKSVLLWMLYLSGNLVDLKINLITQQLPGNKTKDYTCIQNTVSLRGIWTDCWQSLALKTQGHCCLKALSLGNKGF